MDPYQLGHLTISMSKSKVQIANPLAGMSTHTTIQRANDYCNRGVAFFLADGRLKFKQSNQSKRIASDVYVDQTGVKYWNGARSHYVNGKDIAMFPPCCNVVFPKVGTKRAAQRYA